MTGPVPLPTTADLWVFAYGSLIWNPGFAFSERVGAEVRGYHRALCVRSTIYRGTRARPGLVLGLSAGGVCRGVAYRIAASQRVAVIGYLRRREQVTRVYREIFRPVRLLDGSGRVIRALMYVADPGHGQYIGGLDLSAQRRIVRQSAGRAGANIVYVLNTWRGLADAGIWDPKLWRVLAPLSGQGGEWGDGCAKGWGQPGANAGLTRPHQPLVGDGRYAPKHGLGAAGSRASGHRRPKRRNDRPVHR